MEKLGLWEQGITAGGEPMEGEDSLYNFSQLLFDGSMTVRWEVGGNSIPACPPAEGVCWEP